MKKLTAIVSGRVQEVGYRGRVIEIASAFGLKGMVENLEDVRVKIIAEGDDERLKWFESAIDIRNTLINVSSIDKEYSPAFGEFDHFGKLVIKGETDARLDKGVEVMKDMLAGIENINNTLIDGIKDINKTLANMNSNLGGKMDLMITGQDGLSGKMDLMITGQDGLSGKMDKSLAKQDRMLEKQDELLVEVKDMNQSLNEKLDKVLDRDIVELKADVSEIKAALKAKGII